MRFKACAALLFVLFIPSQTPAAVLLGGAFGDAQTSIGYNPTTGEVFVDVASGLELGALDIASAAGIFTGDPAMNLGGSFDIDDDDTIFKFDPGGFGSLSFGNVAQTLQTEAFILADFTVSGAVTAGGGLGPVDLIYIDEHVWNTAAVSELWSTAGNWLQPGVPAPNWIATVQNVQAFAQTAVVSGNSTVAKIAVDGVSDAMTLHVQNGVALTSSLIVDVDSLGVARVDGTLATGELNVNAGGGVRVELSTPGAVHVSVDGDVNLASTTTLTIDPGTPPLAGAHLFPILQSDADSAGGETVNGIFGTVSLPGDDGLGRRYSVLYENRAADGVGAVDTVKVGLARPGDADFDGLVDALDLLVASPFFGTTTPTNWRQGNWNDTGGSQGIVDALDLLDASPFFSQTYGEGDLLLGGDDTTPGQNADGEPSICYDYTTGEVTIDTDGSDVNSYVLDSLSGIFTGLAPNFIGGTFFQTDNDFRIAENFFNPTLSGTHNLGAVAQTGLTLGFLLNDLTLQGGLSGNPSFEFDLVVKNTPEPSTIVLLALGLVGLAVAARRRR